VLLEGRQVRHEREARAPGELNQAIVDTCQALAKESRLQFALREHFAVLEPDLAERRTPVLAGALVHRVLVPDEPLRKGVRRVRVLTNDAHAKRLDLWGRRGESGFPWRDVYRGDGFFGGLAEARRERDASRDETASEQPAPEHARGTLVGALPRLRVASLSPCHAEKSVAPQR